VVHPDRFFEELLDSLELPHVGACRHLTDPETGVFTSALEIAGVG
jgi:hypothetical protein